MPTEEQAVTLLEELGLTEYEARCFVALSRVPQATASDIASLSEVPRSPVYDAVDRLHRRGLVDIQQSDPREYRAISSEAAIDALRAQHETTLSATADALSRLRRTDEIEEEGAWAIADHDYVTGRIGAILEEADDEIYVLVGDDDTVDEYLCDHLATAGGRGVTTIVEVGTEAVADRIRSAVPDGTVLTTELATDPAELEGKQMGRIVMVDRRAVLISAMSGRTHLGRAEETAIWASGPDHGLVVGLRHVLGSRIDDRGLGPLESTPDTD